MRKSLILGNKADVQKMKEKRVMVVGHPGQINPAGTKMKINDDQPRITTFNHPILGNN